MTTEYYNETLENGLALVGASRAGSRLFSLALRVEAGARDDPPGAEGLSHLAEHLAFRGGNEERAERLGRLGADLNAASRWEDTIFTISGHVDLLDQALEFASSILRGPSIAGEHIQQELAILQHEARATFESKVDAQARRIFARLVDDKTLAGRKSAISIPKARRVAPLDVLRFHRERYDPRLARLSLASPLPPNEAAARAAATVGTSRPAWDGDGGAAPNPRGANNGGGLPDGVPAVVFQPALGPQSMVLVSFVRDAEEASADAAPAIAIARDILAGGQHSDLFRAIRQRDGMAYHVGGEVEQLNGRSIFTISALVLTRNANAALSTILAACERVRAGGVAQPEFDESRARMARWFETIEESPVDLCGYFALAPPRFGDVERPPTPLDRLEQLRSLSHDRFQSICAGEFIHARRVAILMGGLGFLARVNARRLARREA